MPAAPKHEGALDVMTGSLKIDGGLGGARSCAVPVVGHELINHQGVRL